MGFVFFGSLDFGGVLFGIVGCGGRSRKSATPYGIWLYREGFAKRQFGVSVGILFPHPNGIDLRQPISIGGGFFVLHNGPTFVIDIESKEVHIYDAFQSTSPIMVIVLYKGLEVCNLLNCGTKGRCWEVMNSFIRSGRTKVLAFLSFLER